MESNIEIIIAFGFGVGAFFSIIPFIIGFGIYTLLSTFEDIANLN